MAVLVAAADDIDRGETSPWYATISSTDALEMVHYERCSVGTAADHGRHRIITES